MPRKSVLGKRGGIIMSIVAETKCARCDRKYSGVRSRCPYCGARRIGRGKYSEDADNSKGKMLIGVLILAALVLATGFLIFTAPEDPNAGLGPSISDSDQDPNYVEEEPPDTSPPPTPELPTIVPEPPSPQPQVSFVTITYNGRKIEDFTEAVGKTVPLGARVEPVGIQEEIIWMSSDRSVFEVTTTNADGTAAKVTPISKGTAILTVSVGGVEAECIVRVRVG